MKLPLWLSRAKAEAEPSRAELRATAEQRRAQRATRPSLVRAYGAAVAALCHSQLVPALGAARNMFNANERTNERTEPAADERTNEETKRTAAERPRRWSRTVAACQLRNKRLA